MRIHDNGVDRDMTEDEIAAHQTLIAQWEKEKVERAGKAIALLSAKRSAYTKLGLTAEEIEALLG